MMGLADQGASRSPVRDAGRPAVVVIEDEAIVLAGYQMLFESWGYHVIAAQSVDEAIDLLTEETAIPGFILADFRLREGQTGTELMAWLRTRSSSCCVTPFFSRSARPASMAASPLATSTPGVGAP